MEGEGRSWRCMRRYDERSGDRRHFGGHQRPSAAINGHQRPPEAIRGNQRQLEVIGDTHLWRPFWEPTEDVDALYRRVQGRAGKGR